MLLFPFAQHRADLLALKVLLRAAKVAGDDGKCHRLRIAGEVTLAHVGERANHYVLAVVGDQLGRHGLQLAAEKKIEKEGRQNIVAMMAERDLGGAKLGRYPIKNATTQSRAQRAHRAAVGNDALDDAVGVLLLDVKGDAAPGEIGGQHVGGKIRLLLVEIDGDNFKPKRRALPERQQDVQQSIAILAAGHAHHHPVAGFDHREVANGLPRLTPQALPQLVGFELLPAPIDDWAGCLRGSAWKHGIGDVHQVPIGNEIHVTAPRTSSRELGASPWCPARAMVAYGASRTTWKYANIFARMTANEYRCFAIYESRN